MTEKALPRIGVFVCDCGTNIAGTVDTAAVEAYARDLTRFVGYLVDEGTHDDPIAPSVDRAAGDLLAGAGHLRRGARNL